MEALLKKIHEIGAGLEDGKKPKNWGAIDRSPKDFEPEPVKETADVRKILDAIIKPRYQKIFETVISDADIDFIVVEYRKKASEFFASLKRDLEYAEKNLELTRNPKYIGLIFKSPYIFTKDGSELQRTKEQLADDAVVFENMVQEKNEEYKAKKQDAAKAVADRLITKAKILFEEDEVFVRGLEGGEDEISAISAEINGLREEFFRKISEESEKIVSQW